MFTHNKDLIYLPKNMFIWFVLACQGGMLNAGGFMAVRRFVSHITGFATMFGINGITKNWTDAFLTLLVPVFFLFGAMLSAWFIDRRRLKNLAPQYRIIFVLITFNLLLVTILGYNGHFGKFGAEFTYGSDYFLLFILALTCGLQNAVITTASSSMIRTTHLTGPMTDFGIGLVRLWTMRHTHNKELVFVSWCRFGTILSFILGSLIGAYVYSCLEYLGFLLPVCTSAFVWYRLRPLQEV